MSNKYNAKRSKNIARIDLRNSTIMVIYESQNTAYQIRKQCEKNNSNLDTWKFHDKHFNAWNLSRFLKNKNKTNAFFRIKNQLARKVI